MADEPSHEDLLQTARERWKPGTGPWSKEGDLDQADLALLEESAASFSVHSDERGLLSGCVGRLVQEVRRARGWSNPPSEAPEEPPLLPRTVRVLEFAREHKVDNAGAAHLLRLVAYLRQMSDNKDLGELWERAELDFLEHFGDAPWCTDDFPEVLNEFVRIMVCTEETRET